MKTWSRRVATFMVLCTAHLVFLTEVGHSASLILPIEDYRILSGENGTIGILIDFGSLDTLTGKRILYAKCYLDIGVDTCAGAYDGLIVKPLVEPWSSVASGTISLTDSTRAATTAAFTTDADLGQGTQGDTGILLTELLQAWVDKRMASNGLVLLPQASGCVYQLQTRTEYPGNGYGKLLVKYVDKSE